MTTILSDTAATALWHDLVREAEQHGRAPLDEDLESYLVFVLMRHLRDDALGRQVLGVDYLLSLHERGRQRGEALRTVGDRCLLIAGLYPEQARRRLVTLDYFIGLGVQAYAELAAAAQLAMAELYTRLSAAFGRMVRVLVALRRLTAEHDPLDMIHRYELALADPGVDFPGAVLLASPSTHSH